MRGSRHSSSPKGRTDCSQKGIPQCNRGDCQKVLYIVGIGPGSIEHMSGKAMDVLEHVETVVGYTTYMDLIRPLIEGKKTVSTGMTKEVDRVQQAIDIACSGRSCAIVCSGDPGIYALAGLVFDICAEKKIKTVPLQMAGPGESIDEALKVEVVPGIPALSAGASLLGAPLTHDFAVISLSDLLTPWETIAGRLKAAAQADFVIVLYNPKSKKRVAHLRRAQQIIQTFRDGNTPVGIVRGAMRENQHVQIVRLRDLDMAEVDMQTTVFVGNRHTYTYSDFMVTPRGYATKYNLKSATETSKTPCDGRNR